MNFLVGLVGGMVGGMKDNDFFMWRIKIDIRNHNENMDENEIIFNGKIQTKFFL